MHSRKGGGSRVGGVGSDAVFGMKAPLMYCFFTYGMAVMLQNTILSGAGLEPRGLVAAS